jgi:hypothetical protein
MCRTGGRRCPSHSDPKMVTERNARRRAAYAAKVSNVIPAPVYNFPSITESLPYMDGEGNSPEEKQFFADQKAFFDLVDPDAITMPAENEDRDLTEEEAEEARLRHEEFYTLRDYTEDSFNDVREYLIDGEIFNNVDHEKTVASLDRAIAKATPPKEDRVLYRGLAIPADVIDDERVDSWLEERFPVGGVISQKNYMSTSVSPSVANNFSEWNSSTDDDGIIMQILSKKGAPLGLGTSYRGLEEMEVLIPRDAKFKVVEVIRNTPYDIVKGTRTVSEERKTIIRVVDAS